MDYYTPLFNLRFNKYDVQIVEITIVKYERRSTYLRAKFGSF